MSSDSNRNVEFIHTATYCFSILLVSCCQQDVPTYSNFCRPNDLLKHFPCKKSHGFSRTRKVAAKEHTLPFLAYLRADASPGRARDTKVVSVVVAGFDVVVDVVLVVAAFVVGVAVVVVGVVVLSSVSFSFSLSLFYFSALLFISPYCQKFDLNTCLAYASHYEAVPCNMHSSKRVFLCC